MVSGIGSVGQHHAFARGHQAVKTEQPPTESQREVDSSLSPGADHVPGVIRNLVDGHYSGVADVRLRIVHADRIAELQAADAEREAAAWRASLEVELGAAVDDFAAQVATSDPAAGEPVASAVEAFKEAVATPDADLAAAIGALEEALYAALTPADAADPAEESLAETPEQSTADPIAALLTSLRDLISATVSGTSTDAALPPLSEYSGKGKAYARFLEIYQAMDTHADSPLPEATAKSIDLAV
jgi:hypothetical protein